MHEADEPNALAHLRHADVLAGEDVTEMESRIGSAFVYESVARGEEHALSRVDLVRTLSHGKTNWEAKRVLVRPMNATTRQT